MLAHYGVGLDFLGQVLTHNQVFVFNFVFSLFIATSGTIAAIPFGLVVKNFIYLVHHSFLLDWSLGLVVGFFGTQL